MAAGLNGDTRTRCQISQPTGLRRVLDVFELGDEMMPGATILEINVAVALQVGRAREKAESEKTDPAHDEVMLVGTFEAERDVRFAHGQAEFPWIGDQFDHEIGLLYVK